MTAQWDRLRAAIDKLPPDWAKALRVVCDDLQAGRALTKRQRDALARVVSSDLHESHLAVWEIAWTLKTLAKHGAPAFDYMAVDDAIACAERGQ